LIKSQTGLTMVNKQTISAYLYFGYLPLKKETGFLSSILKEYIPQDRSTEYSSQNELVDGGVKAFLAAFQSISGQDHIVPLSGGIDSRAVLGGLLSQLSTSEITAVTFGIPNSFDYKLGKQVAEKVRIRHEVIDLTQVELTQAAIEKTALELRPAWLYLFDAFYNRNICSFFGEDSTYWSGFMGGLLCGRGVPFPEAETWEEALSFFVSGNRVVGSMILSPLDFDPLTALPDSPEMKKDHLSYNDQMNFNVRMQSYIIPTVIPAGYDYRTPLLAEPWLNFTLNIPDRAKQGTYIYQEVVNKAFPELFSIPTRNSYCLPLDSPAWKLKFNWLYIKGIGRLRRKFPYFIRSNSPDVQYLDFNEGIRRRSDLKELVYSNIQDLKKRGVVDWIDIDNIWTLHQKRRANYGDALTSLTALEINLKVRT